MTATPRFRVALALSLDGYIAAADGSVDWLNPLFTPEIDFVGFMQTIGVTVWGRKTFDQARARGEFTQPGGRAVIMTTRPLPPDTPEGIEAFEGDVRELADRLHQELAGTGKDIWLGGGGDSLRPFHDAGLIDRWEIAIMPALLGDGIPLFPKRGHGGASPLEALRLVRIRSLSNGIVTMEYEPASRSTTPIAPPMASPAMPIPGITPKKTGPREKPRKAAKAKRGASRSASARKPSTKASARKPRARKSKKRPGRSR